MATGGSNEQIVACFRQFDVSGTGAISRGELGAVLKVLNPAAFSKEEKVDALLKEMDTNGDGSIQYQEFVDWVLAGSEVARQAMAAKTDLTSTNKDPAGYLFSLIDTKKDKRIDEEEWEKWTEACGGEGTAGLSGEVLELLEFETALLGSRGEEDEDEDAPEPPTTLDKKMFVAWLASIKEEHAKELYASGTRSAKIVSIQALPEFAECPHLAIAKALDLKMGSTTSAAEHLRQNKGKWNEEEEEEDDE